MKLIVSAIEAEGNLMSRLITQRAIVSVFKGMRQVTHFTCNHLRPCPLLDNPGALADMVHESGAKSTDVEAPEDVDDLTAKCVGKAEAWAVKAGKLWEESHPNG